VLSNEERKAIYDSSSGYSQVGSFIKSKTHTLTVENYSRLVSNSKDFWVIQVFMHENSES